jgi:chromosome partitioning protein
MKLLTITGYKGGTGKSTSAIHIAAYFAERGRTILIDGDPNRTALKWSERGQSLPFTVADERNAMRQLNGHDFAIIDTQARPDSDDLKELAKGCDLLILPTAPDVLGLEPMLETARDLGSAANFRALITIVPPYPSKEGETMQADLREAQVPVFDVMIRRTANYQKSALQGKIIRDLEDSRAKTAWKDYELLGQEIERIINK